MKRNHTVQVGDIFTHSFSGECGSSTSYYQVVQLRGKTLADICQIGCDFLIDETCDPARSQCRVFPKKDEFYNKANIITTRVAPLSSESGYCLQSVLTREDRYFRKYYFPYDPKELHRISGYDGRYVTDKLGLEPKTEE